VTIVGDPLSGPDQTRVCTTRDISLSRPPDDAVDWLTVHLAELWERVKDHEADCTCWACHNWQAATR
jgi:hypothetical protein